MIDCPAEILGSFKAIPFIGLAEILWVLIYLFIILTINSFSAAEIIVLLLK